jgi:hypothetical protein
MHTLLNFVNIIYLWNGHYNTSFHVIMYVLLNYGIGIGLQDIN